MWHSRSSSNVPSARPRIYGLVVIDAVAAFVVKRYTDHPESLFERSVIHRGIDGYDGFLMTDGAAVDRPNREGAIRRTGAEFENPS